MLFSSCYRYDEARKRDTISRHTDQKNRDGCMSIRIASIVLTAFCLAGIARAVEIQYQSVTVRDLLIDGPTLAAKHAHIVVTGVYAKEGVAGMLFQDEITFFEVNQGQLGIDRGIPLLTEHASHGIREQMINCVSKYPGSYCHLSLRGTMRLCYERNVFGAEQDGIPCLDVKDGELD